MSTVSSAYNKTNILSKGRRSVSFVYSDRFIPLLSLFIKYCSKSFKNSENKIGDRFSACLTPILLVKYSEKCDEFGSF